MVSYLCKNETREAYGAFANAAERVLVAQNLILNRYQPISQAGSGGFGQVIVAWDKQIQRKVAIKTIQLSPEDVARVAQDRRQSLQTDLVPLSEDELREEIQQRWLANIPGLDEARTAATLSDPNIVAVYDFQIAGTTAYLIMEYVEGPTLTQFLAEYDDLLSLDIIASLFSDISHALEMAHENNVLHLDIKPDNVLINKQGQAKVTDFGLATLADPQGRGTAGGGTIGYMPLEQMRREPLDARTDEWSLASITYQMLTGKNPFLARNLRQAQDAIVNAELLLPSLCWDELDEDADEILFQALDPDRDERFDTVEEFADELLPLLGEERQGRLEIAGLLAGEELDDGEDEEPDHDRDTGIHWKNPFTSAALLYGEDDDESPFFVLGHLFSCVATAFLVFVSCMNIPLIAGLTSLPLWAIVGICAFLGAWKEHLGALLSIVALAIALAMNRAPVLALVLILLGVLWWFFVGRAGVAHANSLLSFPACGSFGFAQVGPLATGLTVALVPALLTTIMGTFLALVYASFGSMDILGWQVWAHLQIGSTPIQDNFLVLLKTKSVWVTIASWFVAVAVQSLFCISEKKPVRVVGTIAAAGILLFGVFATVFVASEGASTSPELWSLIPTVVAGLAFIGVALKE